jgi:hypothetical protein
MAVTKEPVCGGGVEIILSLLSYVGVKQLAGHEVGDVEGNVAEARISADAERINVNPQQLRIVVKPNKKLKIPRSQTATFFQNGGSS